MFGTHPEARVRVSVEFSDGFSCAIYVQFPPWSRGLAMV